MSVFGFQIGKTRFQYHHSQAKEFLKRPQDLLNTDSLGLSNATILQM